MMPVRMLLTPGPLVAVGVHDGLSALLAAEAGAKALYVGGFAAAASLGLPDIGLLMQTEMAAHLARIRAVCRDLPIIVDADTGYGAAANVARTVELFEAAGANAIQVEDQAWPKRSGHLRGKRVISAAEMIGKLKAALDARRNPELMIIARTDAMAVEGRNAAIDRAGAYAEAGVDALFIDAPRSRQDLEAIGTLARFGRPLVFNATAGWHAPTLSTDEAVRCGFILILQPVDLLLAAFEAMRHALRGSADPPARASPADAFHELGALLHLPDATRTPTDP